MRFIRNTTSAGLTLLAALMLVGFWAWPIVRQLDREIFGDMDGAFARSIEDLDRIAPELDALEKELKAMQKAAEAD